MKVELKLFAVARQLVGQETIELDLSDSPTAADVRRALIEHVPSLGPLDSHLRISVNAQYVQDDVAIGAGDELACIPPVSGG